MQPSYDAPALRVLETPRGVLVRMPLDDERSRGFRVLTRGDTLLISGEGHVESIRLPRPAMSRRITAWQDSGVLLVHVPLERGVQPTFRAPATRQREAASPTPANTAHEIERKRARFR